MKKYYIEIKYSKHSTKRKETIVIKNDDSKNAIKEAINKVICFDPFCEISQIIVKIKP